MVAATFQFFDWNSFAVSSPIPDDAPVINMTLSINGIINAAANKTTGKQKVVRDRPPDLSPSAVDAV